MRSSYGSVYRYLTNVDNTKQGAYDAGWYWCYYFERPANRSGQSNRRGNMAAGSFWNNYSKYLTDRWMETADGRMYMYKGGTYHTGWMTMDEDEYYFDEKGLLKTGWFTVEGSTYYAQESGAVVTGWYTIENSTYYFGLDGSLQKGWVEADGKQIFLDRNGQVSSVDAAREKENVSSADIRNEAAASQNSPDLALTAPASDPVPISGVIADAVEDMHSAGAAGTGHTAGIAGGAETEAAVEEELLDASVR